MTRIAKDHWEAELKFELDRGAARKVRHHPLLADACHHTDPQATTYFDTSDGRVHREGYSLRVRQVDDVHTQTVKTNGGGAGLFDRGEWEAPVADMAVDAKALKLTPLRKLKKFKGKLEPTVRSDVDRTTWLIDRDGSLVEVVLDSGKVKAGERKQSFHELELELKNGIPEALFGLAQELAEDIPLEIGVLGKEERGLMLAEGALGHAQKARAPALDRKLTVAEAFERIVHECVRHFRLNQALIVAERDPEALHQARVAMRRLRTGFSLFKPAIRQGSLEPLRQELRNFIEPFGRARNLDVFLAIQTELGWRDRRKLQKARDEAYGEVAEALNGQRSRLMMLDLIEWTASAAWQKPVASQPIEKFAAIRLESAWKEVKRRASKVGDLEEQQLHRLRIDIKKLRYAVEFLAPLYRPKKVRSFRASLEAMQDCLGLIHDDMVSRQIVADYELAEISRTDATARSRQLRQLDRRYKRLKRVGQFWR